VLIRLRAVFRRSVELERDRRATYFLEANGPIASVALVVASTSGRAIVYASADHARGATRIFTSPARCFPT
jgi:hypothetical protein